LILENRLERPLGHLGLIGRVRGEEFSPAGKRRYHRGDITVICAGAEEPVHLLGLDIALCKRIDRVERLDLGDAFGQIEALYAEMCGNIGKKLFH